MYEEQKQWNTIFYGTLLKNKGAHFLYHKEPFSDRFFKEPSFSYVFCNPKNIFYHKEPFMKQVLYGTIKQKTFFNGIVKCM